MNDDLYENAETTLIKLLKKYEFGDVHEGLVDALFVVHRQTIAPTITTKSARKPYRIHKLERRAA